MGYWIPEAGVKAFLKKYAYVITVVIVLAILAGSASSYTTYLSIISQYNVTAFEECGEDLFECVEMKNLTQTRLEECRSDLDRTLSLLEDLSPIQSQLTTCRDELSSLQIELMESLGKVSTLLSNATECDKNLLACQDALNTCNATKQNLINNLTVCENNFTSLQSDYNTLAMNVANELCCIYKIGNPDLKYYYVKENKVVCTSEPSETLGTKEFSC